MQTGANPGVPVEILAGSGGSNVNPNTAPPVTTPVSQETRADVVGFLGGMPVQLDREMEAGGKLGDKLAADIATWLEEELRNQEKRIAKLSTWDKQYSGFKEPKSEPYVGRSNTSTQTTRSFVDALVVRIFDAIFGQKKVFICTGNKPPFTDLAPKVEKWFDFWVKKLACLKDKLFSPLLQAIKSGTGIGKLDYVVKNKTVYRYASQAEIARQDPNLVTFKNGQQGIKKTLSSYQGVDFFPIDRADWVISSDATCIDDAHMCGFRKWYRKAELEAKVKQGFFTEAAVKRITAAPDKLDETKENRAKSAFKELSPDTKDRYAVWELWVKYDVDEDGEEDDIVVNFHPTSGTLARNPIYNPLFMGFRPFVDLIFYRKEFSTDGVGVCEIMEKFQEELDALHNQRIDRYNQINGLQLIIKAGSDMEDYKPRPGGVHYTTEEVDRVVFPIQYPNIFPATTTEEGIVMRYAQEAVGTSPSFMGQSTAERPVAKETIALLGELNKKVKYGIDNIRDKITLIGRKALEITSQYQPKLTYLVESGGGYQEEVLDFPCEFLLDGLVIDMAASSEMLNTEIRREINLNKYFLIKDYSTNLASMVQAIVNPMIPPDFKVFIFMCAKIGHEVMTKILEDFGGNDAEQIVAEIPLQLLQKNLMPPPGAGQGGKPGTKPGTKPGKGGPPRPTTRPTGPPQRPQGPGMPPPGVM